MQVARIWRINLSRRIKMGRERGREGGWLVRDGSLLGGKERRKKEEEKKKKKEKKRPMERSRESRGSGIALTILIPVCSGRVWWWGYW